MENKNSLILTQADFQKLTSLIGSVNHESVRLLEDEIGRAQVVADEELPQDVVSMNSKIVYQNLDTGKETTVTLVYPYDASIEENKISVLAPVGSALIGLRVGQVIEWPVPGGKKNRFKVISVLSQNQST